MIKFTNNASATLAASINSTVTAIALTAGQGALFPSTGGGDYFYATLVDSSNNLEIVKVTTRAVDNFTVVRAQDGTTAKSFLAGDRIELRPIAAALEEIASGINIEDLPAGTTLDSVEIITSSGTQTLTNKTLTSPTITEPDIESPAMTGVPTTPTAAPGTSSTQVASTEFVGVAVSNAIPSGTKMLFAQTAAPTGWTKDTTNDNAALRVVSGAVGSGGTVDFTTAFTSRSITGTVGATTLSVSQIPSHTHSTVLRSSGGTIAASSAKGQTASFGATDGGTGGNGSHNHTFTGTAIDLSVKYVDVIIATKD